MSTSDSGLELSEDVMPLEITETEIFEPKRQETYLRISASSENQISLRIHTVRSESTLGAFIWIANDTKFHQADNEDPNQTTRMSRLI